MGQVNIHSRKESAHEFRKGTIQTTGYSCQFLTLFFEKGSRKKNISEKVTDCDFNAASCL